MSKTVRRYKHASPALISTGIEEQLVKVDCVITSEPRAYSEMASHTDIIDLLTTQLAERSTAILKVLAGFTRIVARLRAIVQWRPLRQDLSFEVDAIGDILCKQDDLTASVRVAAEDRLGAFGTFGSSDRTYYSESANRQQTIDH